MNGYRNPIPDEVRWAVFERDDFRCRDCGARRFLTLDHIHPVSQGGADDIENLQTLCRRCNSKKSDKIAGVSPRQGGFKYSAKFARLVMIEPQLDTIYKMARACRKDKSGNFCANRVWYGYYHLQGLKERLSRCVGWSSESANPYMHTSEAYDIAYDTIYAALPDCQHEGECA